MRFPNFIGPTYTINSVNVDCQRCINLYPELDEMNTGKGGEKYSLVGTPGLVLNTNHGSDYAIRGMYTASNGYLYYVYGPTLYMCTTTTSTYYTVGTIGSNSGQVSMSDNGTSLFLVDGTNGYYTTLGTQTLTQTLDPNWLGSNVVDYMDGFFIFADPNTNTHYTSNFGDVTFYGNQVEKEGFADPIVSFATLDRTLWLFGSQTTEVWYDAGSTPNPFQYIEGGFMQFGCAATFSVAKLANTLFWLSQDQSGSGIVMMSQGYSGQRISTQAVERAIQGYSKISDAVGFGYQQNGHSFYQLSFPTGNQTWVYDLATGLWHERAYYNQGTLERHRANCYAFAFGKHLVGDYATGQIYELDLGTYTDNGNTIVRKRVSPHLSQDMRRVFYNDFQLDLEVGVGIDGSGQGTSPQAILKWSDDGGHSWSNEKWASIGAIGLTKTRAIWRRLGQSRSRVFDVTITDPVKVNLIGAELNLETGAA